MVEIDGKQYELQEAYAIPANEVETQWSQMWGEPDTYEVDLARKDMKVTKCWVLIEATPPIEGKE